LTHTCAQCGPQVGSGLSATQSASPREQNIFTPLKILRFFGGCAAKKWPLSGQLRARNRSFRERMGLALEVKSFLESIDDAGYAVLDQISAYRGRPGSGFRARIPPRSKNPSPTSTTASGNPPTPSSATGRSPRPHDLAAGPPGPRPRRNLAGPVALATQEHLPKQTSGGACATSSSSACRAASNACQRNYHKALQELQHPGAPARRLAGTWTGTRPRPATN
jgi:hypothetical protein